MSEIENIELLDMAFQISPGYVKIKSKYAVLFPQSQESLKAKSSSLIYFLFLVCILQITFALSIILQILTAACDVLLKRKKTAHL